MNTPMSINYSGVEWIQARLPAEAEAWPSPVDRLFVGPAPEDFEVTRREAARYVAGKPWVWPNRPHYFLCDIHADADAWLSSLVATGGVRRTGSGDGDIELTAEGKTATFVIGGDCLDKGPSNLRLLRAVKSLIDLGARVELLAGNHDLRTVLGVAFTGSRDPKYEHLFVRMGQKSIRLFKEIYDEYLGGAPLPDDKELREQLFPSENWYEEFPKIAGGLIPPKKLQKELVRIRQKTHELASRCEQLGMTLPMVAAAVKKCRELFLTPGGEFHWFYARMKLAYQAGSFLFVHAGLDDTTAHILSQEGVEGLNRRYRELVESDLFTLYHGPLGNTFRTKYRDIDFPLSDAGVRDVHAAGVYAIVHGHRNLLRGQRIMFRRTLLNFECDSSVDANTRLIEGLAGAGGAATIVDPDYRVLAVSTDYPRIKVFEPAELDRSIALMRSPTDSANTAASQVG